MTEAERVYAIGDVHGDLVQLKAAHKAIENDLADDPADSHVVVHIGDYTDRGPDSAGVIGFLIDGADRGAPWVNLYGNHDRMFRRFMESAGGRDPCLRPLYGWLSPRLGGRETLASYGVIAPEDVHHDGAELWRAARDATPPAHLAFLRGLRASWRWRDVFFAHAGVRPGAPLEDQTEDDLLWIRGQFHESRADHGALVVHGHTPVDQVEDHGNRIAIDTGVGYGGPLSCVVFDASGIRVLGGERLR